MAIQKNDLTTLRLDSLTKGMLNNLIRDLNFNKSQVIRKSIRLLNELNELKKQNDSEFLIRSMTGEKTFILLG